MKKGQSQIFLAILILMIGLALIVVLALWLPKIAFKAYPEEAYEKSYLRSRACLGIEEIDGLFGLLTIRNCGQIPLTNLKFFMDSLWFDLDIEKLDPQESQIFYDLPIVAGNHTVVVTADYAETPARFIDVPPYVCIEGRPLKREDWDITERTGTWPPELGDWVITDTTSCVCSYNSRISISYQDGFNPGNIYVLGNGNLSIYRCILWYEGYNFNVEDNATLNFTKSILDSSPGWHDYVSFEGNSTIYLTNSSFANPPPRIQQATNITAINSSLGEFRIESNIPHNLSISNFIGMDYIVSLEPWIPIYRDSPMTKYIRAEGSRFTMNFTNVSFDYIYFGIADNSNTKINNATFAGTYIYSEYPHNLTIRNWGCEVWGEYLDNYFKAEGSNFTFNGTHFEKGWTTFYTNGGSNNTIIDSCIQSIMINYYQNSTNTFINFSSNGGWYLNGMNYTMNFINSRIYSNSEIVFGECGWNCMPWIILNFSDTTITDRNLKFDYGDITFFGNVTFLGNANVTRFADPTIVNVTRYFPTIIKYTNGNPASGTAYIANKFGDMIWEGNIFDSYIEPKILFNRNNYGPGNLTLYLIDDYEYEFISTGMPLLKNTPINLTIPYCDVFISSLPYTITENNTYYCLTTSFSNLAGTAIDFSSGVQNSTLNCMYNTLDGDDSGTDYGVYLTGSATKNNTIKNCKIIDFDSGIFIDSSSNNTLFSNLVYDNNYGIHLKNSIDNTLMRGSIHDNNYDYYSQNVGTTNYFRDSNFTNSRKIKFEDEKSWFNYNNDTIERTVSNLWLKTNISSSTTITRKLINWNQSLMQWNDTSNSQTTTRYNITGLFPNTVYYVYNNSVFTYSLKSGPYGEISFTINLHQNEEHEIKVNKSYNILHFKFDEGSGTIAYDSSAYENNGTLHNGTQTCGGNSTYNSTCPQWTTGKYGSALSFDRSDDYVEVPDSESLKIITGELTVEAWVNLNNIPYSRGIIIAKYGQPRWSLHYDGEGWGEEFGFYLNNVRILWRQMPIQWGQWYHVAVTFSDADDTAILYVNGNPEETNTAVIDSIPLDGNIYIGMDYSWPVYKVNGTIDEVRIYDRVLTQQEIQDDMNNL